MSKKKCMKCEENRSIAKHYYQSSSPNHADKKYPVCKICIKETLKIENETNLFNDEFLERLQDVLLEMNKPFIYTSWVSTVEECSRTHKEPFGVYLKNLMLNFKHLTWKDSEFTAKNEVVVHEVTPSTQIVEFNGEDKNKEDVLRMLGYDPFEGEAQEDKRHLYNKLVDMLDEGTLEDGFKLPAVIEIVKGFNQLDKINRALALITSDTKQLSQNVGGVKSLIDSKEKILKSMLALAKDNGISVNHNNNKSKGAGTLTGIIKTLQEKGFSEGEVNLYDIETAQGMKQVADLSNKSIVAQLQFDENDYTSMIMEQREIIQDLDSKVIKLEEENRLLKKELYKMKKQGDIDES